MTTQGAIFNYEEVIDLHTEANKVSVIGIHTPTGDTPRKLCPGFFQQFKKYKYLGCSVSLVPAATLPADPLQVGAVESGAPTIDPRDMLNPIMFHGCHGNDLGNILNRLYSSGLADTSDLTQILHSDSLDFMSMANYEEDGDAPFLDIMESLYYRALTDNTWKKAHIQRGFRKSGLKPRIYSLATNMQLMGQTTLGTQRAPGIIEGTYDLSQPLAPAMDIEDPVVNPVRYFTPRTVPLGWLDTRQVVPYVAEGEIDDVPLADIQSTIENLIKGKTVWNELPEIYMGIIMLPPAYLQEQYFRLIINHAFAFKGFRGISMSNDMLEMPPNYENWNDEISVPEPSPPEPEPVDPFYTISADGLSVDYFTDDSGTPDASFSIKAATGSGHVAVIRQATSTDVSANNGLVIGAPVIVHSYGGTDYNFWYRKDPSTTVMVEHAPNSVTFTAIQDASALNSSLSASGNSGIENYTGGWDGILTIFDCDNMGERMNKDTGTIRILNGNARRVSIGSR